MGGVTRRGRHQFGPDDPFSAPNEASTLTVQEGTTRAPHPINGRFLPQRRGRPITNPNTLEF